MVIELVQSPDATAGCHVSAAPAAEFAIQLKTPAPSVLRMYPAVQSALGKVQATLLVTAAGALKAR